MEELSVAEIADDRFAAKKAIAKDLAKRVKNKKEDEISSKKNPPLVRGEREAGGIAKKIMPLLQNFFRPEFLNRIDDIIIFSPIGGDVLNKIIKIHVANLVAMIKKEKDIDLALTDNMMVLLAQK